MNYYQIRSLEFPYIKDADIMVNMFFFFLHHIPTFYFKRSRNVTQRL